MKKVLLLASFLFFLAGCGQKAQESTENKPAEVKKEVPVKKEVAKEETKIDISGSDLQDNEKVEEFANLKFYYPNNLILGCGDADYGHTCAVYENKADFDNGNNYIRITEPFEKNNYLIDKNKNFKKVKLKKLDKLAYCYSLENKKTICKIQDYNIDIDFDNKSDEFIKAFLERFDIK